MLYVNISKERKLICSRRVKVWVAPRETVEVDSVDQKFLGTNASALITKEKFDKIVAIKKARRARKIAKRKAKLAKLAKSAKLVKTTKVEKPAKPIAKKKVKKPVEKVVPKEKKITPVDLKTQRIKLKNALIKKNKSDLMAFGKEILNLDLKWKDKKDLFMTKILNAAKKIGYTKIIKKV